MPGRLAIFDDTSFKSEARKIFSDVKNTIARVFDPALGASKFQNAGDLNSYGIELEANMAFWQFWQLRLTYSQLFNNESTLDVSSKPEDFTSKETGSLQINFNRGHWRWNLNGYIRGAAKVLEHQGTIAVFNTMLRYQYGDNLSFGFNVKNIFSKRYDAIVSARGLGQDQAGNLVRAVPRPQRWAYFDLRYEF